MKKKTVVNSHNILGKYPQQKRKVKEGKRKECDNNNEQQQNIRG